MLNILGWYFVLVVFIVQLPLDVCHSVMKNKSGIDPFYLPELS